MTTTIPKLGAICCATITCASLETAYAFYAGTLGFIVVESSVISAALATHWRAPACIGANTVLMQQPASTGTFIRFVEDQAATTLTPYTTLGWAALEFSVASSDAAVEAAEKSGFRVIGASQDLAFSEGALRAGQVEGAFGEVLYFTQVRFQLDNYTLPIAAVPLGPMFIVISAVPTVPGAYDDYSSQFGMITKDPFEAEVPFIAVFQGRAIDTPFRFGALELVPESYLEVDEMGPDVPRRHRPDGRLPAGIAMISFGTEAIDPFLQHPNAVVTCPDGGLYQGRRSLLVDGPYGELIEIIEFAAVDAGT